MKQGNVVPFINKDIMEAWTKGFLVSTHAIRVLNLGFDAGKLIRKSGRSPVIHDFL